MNVLRQDQKHLRRARAATYRKGHERIEAILEAAEYVLVNKGYKKLTMRQIALQTGITVGNLTYYYSTKEALLRDMLESILRTYLAEMERAASAGGDTPADRFVSVVEFLIEDLNTQRTTSLFPELWALANHDEYAAKLMEHMYEEERAVLARLIRAANPDLDRTRLNHYALYVSCSIEGMTMFVGAGKSQQASLQALKKIASGCFLQLVTAVALPTTGRGDDR